MPEEAAATMHTERQVPEPGPQEILDKAGDALQITATDNKQPIPADKDVNNTLDIKLQEDKKNKENKAKEERDLTAVILEALEKQMKLPSESGDEKYSAAVKDGDKIFIRHKIFNKEDPNASIWGTTPTVQYKNGVFEINNLSINMAKDVAEVICDLVKQQKMKPPIKIFGGDKDSVAVMKEIFDRAGVACEEVRTIEEFNKRDTTIDSKTPTKDGVTDSTTDNPIPPAPTGKGNLTVSTTDGVKSADTSNSTVGGGKSYKH